MRLPKEKLGGVCWLARFVDKARAFAAGTLPEEYLARFCDPRGMDGGFLSFFQLDKENTLAAIVESAGDDDRLAEWFRRQPSVTAEKIERWNCVAPDFGRRGHPGFRTFQWAMKHVYPHAPYSGVESLFEVIETDEANAK